MEQHRVTTIDRALVASLIKKRLPGSHKGTHGHALLIAGNEGKMGAAVIAAKACLRTGAGLLTVNVPAEERQILQIAIPEAMLMMRENNPDLSAFSAIGMGPAIGTQEAAALLVENVLQQLHHPVVLDADALTILSQQHYPIFKLAADAVITPHPGEFDRLFGKHDTIEEREAKAIELSTRYELVIVLKGQHTLVCSKGEVYRNTTGNAGLAKGGSGDALTGMILSLLAQGYTALNAAVAAVYLHGLAADLALKNQSVESLLVTDIFNFIGTAFNETTSGL